ncbi:hypothetical protein BSIN_0659 [Burkholderia singularis]|uniref:Uncharacterized protein n=1 Tax=Burkholderia singularis TaxID=1503053 RepID=A0A238H989_9BURK|nr:hypothetical protein BSIN_0659 [Burkholderia singularis]
MQRRCAERERREAVADAEQAGRRDPIIGPASSAGSDVVDPGIDRDERDKRVVPGTAVT